jgi:hypothetical protein
VRLAGIKQRRGLPPALKPLCACHAERRRHSHLRGDIERLAELGVAPAAAASVDAPAAVLVGEGADG